MHVVDCNRLNICRLDQRPYIKGFIGDDILLFDVNACLVLRHLASRQWFDRLLVDFGRFSPDNWKQVEMTWCDLSLDQSKQHCSSFFDSP